jgi:AcrR family transcriptional regulator
MRKTKPTGLKQSERSEKTRSLILKTATRLFARQGFDRTSTATIADEAGVSQGILFHYFKTKENLFWVSTFEGVEQVNTRDKVSMQNAKPSDPIETLKLVGDSLARRAEEFPDITELITRHLPAMDIPPESREAQHIFKRMTVLENIFEEGKAAGFFRKGIDPQIAAFSLIGIFNFNYLRWKMQKKKTSLSDTIHKAFTMFISGVIATK